jgi:CRISPR-associated protein Csb2
VVAVRCQFLLGSYQASDPLIGFGEAEWPPHPARLHEALLAAAWARGDGDAPDSPAVDALRRLEGMAPRIVVPASETRTPATVYVPQNPKPRTQRRKGPRFFPAAVVGDEPTWFLFDDEDETGVLGSLVQEVAFLGSSRSPVCCDLVEDPGELEGIELAPVAAGPRTLRIARPGFTDALIAARFDFPPSVFGAMQGYGPRQPAAPSVWSAGPFGELAVARFVDAFPLTVHHAHVVASAMRRAVLAHAGDSAPALLHGHGAHPHVAFLALSDVGHRYASGAIRGVAIAIPRAAGPQDGQAAMSAFRSVRKLAVDRRLAPFRLEAGGELRALQPERWVGPARLWRSVTPVVVDRHPKAATGGVEGALRVAIAHALLPEPVRIEAATVPFLAGPPAVPAFRGDLPRGMRVHLELEFAEPVRGPVLVGRGRYLGIGLFAPVPGS